MNDNFLLDEDDLPDWGWEIIDKHDLGVRADCPRAGATVLLTDAADILKHASLRTFQEQAISSETLSQVNQCTVMIADALKLAALCSSTPEPGVVTESEDGALTWSPVNQA